MTPYELFLNPKDSALKPSILSQMLFSIERVTDQDGSLSLISSIFHDFTTNKLSVRDLADNLVRGIELFGKQEMTKNVTRFIVHVIPLDQRTQKQQQFVKICSTIGLINLEVLDLPKQK